MLGRATDRHEAAADRAARYVVAGWRQGTPLEPAVTLAVQRSTETETGNGDDGGGNELDPDATHDLVAARRSGGRTLDQPTRARMEAALGTDLSAVRLHTGAPAAELATSLRAEAFTIGSDIFFRTGRPDTSVPTGRHLLAHELAHVAQQSPPNVVRRLYLDGDAAWRARTKDLGFLSGKEKPRSEALRKIDAEVEATKRAYFDGHLPTLQLHLKVLLTAIADWKSTKRDPTGGLRGANVAELEAEATQLTESVRGWLGGRYAAAVHRNLVKRRIVKSWLQSGLREGDRRLRNSCEWLVAGRTQLYVVTETADSEYRGQVNLGWPSRTQAKDANIGAYFPNPRDGLGRGAVYGPRAGAARYDRSNARTDPGSFGRVRRSNGWNGPGYVVVTDTGIQQGPDLFFQTVRHEVQHDADRHRGLELSALLGRPGRTTEQESHYSALNIYDTEYRAHAYQGDPRFDVDQPQPVIRNWILGLYETTSAAWGGNNPTPLQGRFRRRVDRYQNPDTRGFNKYNSVRIDDLYDALGEVRSRTSDPRSPSVVAVMKAVDALDADDAAYVENRAESRMLRQKIERLLTGEALAAFDERLRLLFSDDALPPATIPDY
jgi:hypothetical protein